MTERKTLTVTLETVTPLFLGGAELRPELRPPAFRGALRYWLRAALGGVIGDNNLVALHKLESVVFGSTDSGSSIQVRLRSSLQGRNLQARSEKILPHKEAGRRQAFTADQRFDLSMSQVRSNDDGIWQAACSALNLAVTFGGVGLRSRRGYGTLRVVASSDLACVPLTPTSLEDWKQHLQQTTENATAAARNLAQLQNIALTPLPTGPAGYPCATRLSVIRLCNLEAASAIAAVTQFMQKVPKLQAFGGISPRQASPLWVRPIQLDGQYGLLLTILASRFNGTNYPVVQKFLNENFNGEDISVKGWNA